MTLGVGGRPSRRPPPPRRSAIWCCYYGGDCSHTNPSLLSNSTDFEGDEVDPGSRRGVCFPQRRWEGGASACRLSDDAGEVGGGRGRRQGQRSSRRRGDPPRPSGEASPPIVGQGKASPYPRFQDEADVPGRATRDLVSEGRDKGEASDD